MNKTILFFVIVFCIPASLQARSSAAAGELIYTWLSDSTYRFVYKLYNNCKGGHEPDSLTLCIKNKCSAFNTTIVLQKTNVITANNVLVPNGTEVFNPGCPNDHTTCTDPSSIIPGFAEWWYYGTFTLPSRCVKWEFSVAVDGRDSLVSNLADLQYSCIWATLNNQDFQGVSSPYFKVPPIAYVCTDAPYTYFSGPVSDAYDSMYFRIAYPSRASSCNDTFGNPDNIDTFNSSAYNLFNNPFQCQNTFSLNHYNGEVSFTPTTSQNPVINILCTYYRNGKTVGYVMRDVAFAVASCSFHQLTAGFQVISGNFDSAGSLHIQAGKQLVFSVITTSVYKDAKIIIEDNHLSACNGCFATYHGQYTDSAAATITWNTTIADTGLYGMSFELIDTVCRAHRSIETPVFTMPIIVGLFPAGIQNIDGNNHINVYPNPTSGIVNISLSRANLPASITITDLVGRPVLKTIMIDENTHLNMTPYQNGIYLIHLSSGQISYTTKITLEK